MTSKTPRKPKSASGKAKPISQQSAAPASIVADPAADATALSGKLGELLKLVRRKTGASIEEMVRTTGWQAHSVRGAISGTLRKRLGLTVERSKTDGVTRYRVAP